MSPSIDLRSGFAPREPTPGLPSTGSSSLPVGAGPTLVDDGCFGTGPSMSEVLAGAGSSALQSFVDQAAGKLLAIDDRTPAGEAIAKDVISKNLGTLQGMILDPQAFHFKIKALFKGESSSAAIPIGWAMPSAGTDIVLLNMRPCARLADDVLMQEVPDKGPLVQGNPTVLINGRPASGLPHIAVGKLGTIAAPLELSPNVLMGDATVTDLTLIGLPPPPPPPKAPVSAGGGAGAGSGPGGAAPPKPQPAPAVEPVGEPGSGFSLGGILGKLWNLPNTIIGLAWGGLGMAVGWVQSLVTGAPMPTVTFGNNGIEFHNHPLMLFGRGLTIGNVISYSAALDGGVPSPGSDPDPPISAGAQQQSNRDPGYGLVGDHERQHTTQGEMLGPFYLPAIALSYTLGIAMGGGTHGPNSFMENGPHSRPPRPFAR